MKKFYLVMILLVTGLGFGQVSLTGNAMYKLNIVGYQGRDNNACGDIYGLIYMFVRLVNNLFNVFIIKSH